MRRTSPASPACPLSSSRWPSSVFGMKLAVENQRGADAGAQRGGDDEAILALRGAELLLGKTGGVSVVHHGDRTTASFGEHFGDVHADPGLVRLAM